MFLQGAFVKIGDFIKFKGFSCGIPREQAILRKSKTPRKSPEKWAFLSLAFYNAPSLHIVNWRDIPPGSLPGHPDIPGAPEKFEKKCLCSIFDPQRNSLKTLTSLNKEVRPFFLSDNGIWSFPSVSSLSDYSSWRSWGLF